MRRNHISRKKTRKHLSKKQAKLTRKVIGGGLFGSSKYPEPKEIVNAFLKQSGMEKYKYYGSFRRTFTISTANNPEYQMGKLVVLLYKIASRIIYAAKSSSHYNAKIMKGNLSKYIWYRINSTNVIDCKIPTNITSRQQDLKEGESCPEGYIESQSSNYGYSYRKVCKINEDKMKSSTLNNAEYNKEIQSISSEFSKVKQYLPYLNSENVKLNEAQRSERAEKMAHIIEIFTRLTEAMNRYSTESNREIITYVKESGNIPSGASKFEFLTDPKGSSREFFPCKR